MYGNRFSQGGGTGGGFNFGGYGSGINSTIKNLILANVVVFIFQMVFQGALTEWLAFSTNPAITLLQPWRLFTYMFLHAGFMHILFNMLWLWFLGSQVERALGPKTFLSIYFFSGIIGALVNLAIAPFMGGYNLVVGASGAVYGIMVAFAVLYPNTPIMLFLLPPLKAKFVIGGIIALDVLFLGSNSNVARLVHLGGAAAGYGLVKLHSQGTNFTRWLDYLEYYWTKLKNNTQQKSDSFTSSGGGFGKSSSKKYKPKNKTMYSVSDAEIIEEVEQDELDRILDKIAEKGYEGLTDREKKILFEMSKKN